MYFSMSINIKKKTKKEVNLLATKLHFEVAKIYAMVKLNTGFGMVARWHNIRHSCPINVCSTLDGVCSTSKNMYLPYQ